MTETQYRKRLVIYLSHCLYLTVMLFTACAIAQTQISGAIAINQHWTSANSPYLLSGSVILQNGAALTIDPGVTIYMGANAGLTLQNGSIHASGTAASPINVLSDKARLAQNAAAGDWKQWLFTPGTIDTRLEHVVFAHGRGLVIQGAAPVLNYLTINNQQGSAITIDLAASPSGVGNKAFGNTVNGITVPAGDISTSVNWGLRGIPYFIGSGIVSVGNSPKIATISPKSIQQNSTVNIDIVGTRLKGLTGVQFENTGLLAEVLPGATDTQATVSITASPNAALGKSGARLLVDAGELVVTDALTVVPTQPILDSLTPNKLYLGQDGVDVAINGRNFSNQSSILVAGSTSVTQYVSATTIQTRINPPTTATNLAIKVRTPDPFHNDQYFSSNELNLPVVPGPLSISPGSLTATKGFTKTITVTLPYPATADGVTVDLVSSVPSVGTVPATLNFPAGQTAASFSFAAIDTGNTVITASKLGFVSAQAQVSVALPPNLTLLPTSMNLGVGRTSTMTVNSSVPAGEAGISINLTSSAAQIATVPTSVTIPAGSSSASFTVTTLSLGSASISASSTEFDSGTALIKVRPLSLNLPPNSLVAPGLTRSMPLTLSDPAPASGLVVNLTSSNTGIATIPAAITVPAGQSGINFTLTGVAAGSATITATAPNYQAADLAVTVEALNIGVGNPAVSAISLPTDLKQDYAITLSRPAPVGGIEISLATADPGIATVMPNTISIAEGQTSGGIALATVIGISKGSTTLTASAPGLNSAVLPITVIEKAELAFSTSSLIVGKGLNSYYYEASISRTVNGQPLYGNQDLIVNLTSSDVGKVSVPSSVTIPAGSYYAYFRVTGVDLSNDSPVSISATATGYTAPVAPLEVNVVNPVLTIYSLDNNRSTESNRDDFSISLTTPGANYPGSQTAAADLAIDVAITDSSISGLIPGIYDAPSASSPITQLVIKAGQASMNSAYVGTPTTSGNYKVSAQIAGGNTTTVSTLQTVTTPELRFSMTAVTVGKGLNTYYWEVYVSRTVNNQPIYGNQALTVSLTSSDSGKATVPATVVIPAGGDYATFTVTGVDLTNGVPISIDATATGYSSPSSQLAVNVVDPVLNLVGLDNNRSAESGRDDFYIGMITPGANYYGIQTAAADLPIEIAVTDESTSGIIPGLYDVANSGNPVTQLILKTGQTYTNAGYVDTPTMSGTYKVSAQIAGGNNAVSPLQTVTTPELRFSTSTITVGKGLNTYYWEVTISRLVNGQVLNGNQALTVNLSSSDASKAVVPANVVIPADSYYTTITVTGIDLTGNNPISINASASGYSAPATPLAVNVVNPVLTLYALDDNRSIENGRDDFYIGLTTPGANYSTYQTAAVDLPINVAITDESVSGSIPGLYDAINAGNSITQIVMKAGQSSTNAGYVGTPTANGTYKISAQIAGGDRAISTLQTIATPELRFSTSTVLVGKGLTTYYYEAYVYRVVNSQILYGNQALTVNLSCSAAAICSTPASITIPAGAYMSYFPVTGVDLGNTTISANASGYNSPAQDLAVNVIPSRLNFSGPSDTVVGGQSGFNIFVTAPGAGYSGNQSAANPILVNLTSSTPSVASVPVGVTILPGNIYSSSAQLTGIAAGTMTITASGSGLQSATSNVITIKP